MVCGLLAAMVGAVFGQTIHFEFLNYDDPDYVFNNPLTNQGLVWHNILQVFAHACHNAWFPITYVSQMVDSQIYGANPGGPHLTNVLLHAATAILLFLVLRKMTGAFWRAALVAAVFAIHPLRAESVAWVVERKDVLSGLFFMLTLWAWTDYVQPRPPGGDDGAATPSRWRPAYGLALLWFTLGLLSKSMLVTLPFILLLLDYWPLKRLPASGGYPAGWKLIGEKVPFLLLAVGAVLATMWTQANVLELAQSSTPYWRIGNAALAYVGYLGHFVYPAGLAMVYPHSDANPPIGQVALALLLLGLISAGVAARRRTQPALLVGWFWYLGMLLPVIDSMLANQNARADRYTYLPQIGLNILVTWGVAELVGRWRHRRVVLGTAAAAVLTALMVDAYMQTGYWKNTVSLWTRSVACTSENFFAEDSLGCALSSEQKWQEAIPHFERAIRFKPDFPNFHINLGVALANLGKREEAIRYFQRALQLDSHSDEAYYHLAGVLGDQGKTAEAIACYERAIQIKPARTEAHYELGLALASQAKWDEALPHYEQAFHQKLDRTDAQYITGVALAAHQKWDQAIALYEQVLRVRPDHVLAQYRLGLALVGGGQPSAAGQHFQQALTLATTQGDAALVESIRTQLNSLPPALPGEQPASPPRPPVSR